MHFDDNEQFSSGCRWAEKCRSASTLSIKIDNVHLKDILFNVTDDTFDDSDVLIGTNAIDFSNLAVIGNQR